MASKKLPPFNHWFCENCGFYFKAYRDTIAFHEAGKCKEPAHV